MRIYGRSFLISNGINVANELYSHCLRPHDNLAKEGFAQHITAYEMSRSAISAAKARVAGQPYADG
jgi:hypothetical protein